MNPDELMAASATLRTLFDRLAALPEDREQAMVAAMMCQYASLVVVELAAHLTQGIEPYEALRRSAIGTLPISPTTATMLRLLTTRESQA